MGYYLRKFDDMLGKTLVNVERVGSDKLVFTMQDGEQYAMEHFQDCCENVYIEDVVGDFSDLYGYPLLLCEEVTNSEHDKERYESCTWTFYKLATVRGYVDIRWVGSSNGYYSESVDFYKIGKEEN